MFFPSGRCRNGNDCKYPHILPDGPLEVSTGHRRGQSMGFGPIEERMGNLRIRENSPKANGINGINHGGVNGHASRDAGRFPNGKPLPAMNGVRRGGPPIPPQRLPTEDDFPVLQGSHKGSPSPAPSISLGSLTAAQVLQAPAPKKEMVNGKTEHPPTIANGDHANGIHSPASTSALEVAVSA